jgi:hypothetical protein
VPSTFAVGLDPGASHKLDSAASIGATKLDETVLNPNLRHALTLGGETLCVRPGGAPASGRSSRTAMPTPSG